MTRKVMTQQELADAMRSAQNPWELISAMVGIPAKNPPEMMEEMDRLNPPLTEEEVSALEPKEILQVGRCPYCGDEVGIEPTDLCCGEVHGEYVYEDEDGNEKTEEEYRNQFGRKP